MINTQTILTAMLTAEGLQPAPYTAASLDAAVQYEPDGVYTVTRTYRHHYALKLDAHLDRLEESARLQGIPLRLDRPRLRSALRQLCRQARYENARFRITVPANDPDTLYFALEPLNGVPPEVRAHGVPVQAFPLHRDNARVKSTAWMRDRADLALADGIYTGLLLSPDGRILEGFSSNFYAVLGGALWTANEDILHGISRQIVLDVAPEVIPVRLEAVALTDVPHLAEAFLTSSSRGVIPIVAVDGQPIGGGVPGTVTQAITHRYDQWTEAHLEPI